MKTVISILATTLILFTSCKKESHKEIRSAFQQYVKENFGEPNNMKEITSIELKDTFNFETYRKGAQDALENDSIIGKRRDAIFLWFGDKANHPLVKKDLFKYRVEIYSEIIAMHNRTINHNSARYNLKNKLEEAQGLSDYYIHYLIKARVEVNGIKEIREYHAYKNKNGKIEVKDRDMKKEELPEYWIEVADAGLLLMNYVKETAKSSNKIYDIFTKCGISIDEKYLGMNLGE